MNLSDMITHVREQSGQSSDAVIRSAIQLAAQEVWDSVDLPNTLQELRVCTNSERYITLPWKVYKIRKIRSSNARVDYEINRVTAHYNDMNYYQSDIVHRILRKVPLENYITNASTLKFALRKAEDFDVVFTITGETDLAGRCIEPVTIAAGHTTGESVERYINIPDSITKNVLLSTDTDIIDASLNRLATFPAHLKECTYYLAQMYDRCISQYSPYNGCVDIVYKPHMPPLEDDNDIFPSPFNQVVIYKALEQIYLKSKDTIQVAQAYNSKALAILQQFTMDELTGTTLRPSVKANPFVTRYGGQL